MENGKEMQTGTFYAVAIPSNGKFFIIFPDFNHLLPQVSTLDQCPATARQLLKSILLRRLIDGETRRPRHGRSNPEPERPVKGRRENRRF